jgi:hypothetical protein
VDIDDVKNPEHRKGRREPVKKKKPRPWWWSRLPDLTEEEARRARFAAQTARAEFGRFYWSDQLRRQMERELEQSRRRQREAAERRRRRQRNGGGK